jgi:glycosyltransferase involved in cell wall biosynthesis
MKLSVIIPCYNERTTIQQAMNAVKGCSMRCEIIVNDFSRDGT